MPNHSRYLKTDAPPIECRTLMELRRRVRAEGFYSAPAGRVALGLAFHLALVAVGVAVIVSLRPLPCKAIGFLLCTAGNIGMVTLAHTASHRCAVNNRWWNDAICLLGFTLFFQIPTSSWRHRHIAVHHGAPNVIGVDGDVDLSPWLTYTREQREEGSRVLRWLHRHQILYFPILLGANCFNIQGSSLRHLWLLLRSSGRATTRHWVDVAGVVVHWLIWYIGPAAFFPLRDVLLFNLVRGIMMGYAMFLVFAPAHWPSEARALSRDHGIDDPVLLQTWTTVNFRTGHLGRLLCSGVEYQIEHHLFPGVCHVHYGALSLVVRDFCRRNGYPYRTLGWWEGVWKSLLLIHTPKPTLRSVARLSERKEGPYDAAKG